MPFRKTEAAVLALLAAAVVTLLAAGFRLDGLPFMPGATYSDAATSHYPATLFLRESILEGGQFPLWRETFMAGAPFAANPLNKTAYPLQWLALLLPPLLHLNGLIVLHLALAGWGMWRWARRLGLGTAAATVSTLAYLLAPRLWIGLGAGHLDLVYALAWWPWLMAAAGQLGNKPGWRAALWTGLCAGLVLLADVRLALYAWPMAAVALVLSWQRAGRPRAVFPWAGLAFVTAAGLAVSVVAPLAAWSSWLNRAELTAAEAGVFSLTLGNLLTVFAPLPAASHETIAYLGMTTLLLAAVGGLALPRRWRWTLLTALALVSLWALGANGPLWPALAGQGGLLSWFRVPARAWTVVVVLAAPLAGLGSERLMRWDESDLGPSGRSLRWTRLGAFGLTAAALVAGLVLLTFPAGRTSGIHFLAAGGTLGVVLLLMLAGRLRGRALSAGLLLALTADGAFGARAWAEWRPPAAWLEPMQAVTAYLQADGAARIYSPDYRLPQAAAATAGLRLFGGVDPFQIAGVTNAIKRAGGVTATAYSVVVPPLDEVAATGQLALIAEPDAALLAEWDVSHVVIGFPLERPGLELAAEIGGSFIYRNTLHEPHTPPALPPDYPDGWPDLPTNADIASRSAITWLSWLVSAAVLIACLTLLSLGAIVRRGGRA